MEPNKTLIDFIHPSFVHLSSPPYFQLVWRFSGQHWKLRPPYEQPTQSHLHRR
ncbi:hypothetical protein HanRHA438_Chr04g0163951 [Helianthus annuus]|nr:hypothetical protein HanHA300_Chr04g0126441 [Helianthus annuus]KAJ0596140.1 hypothetical protein HanHA89_Chr04g0139351 [Helianthus annuus]KAJ0756790.1 hypothetical protein HanLR1_Chr04g0131091 [Helianthus annuus]KAJ0925816.1 hypothetical protein HanRHA438_Chr04g0163951 [Helianthus annuus]